MELGFMKNKPPLIPSLLCVSNLLLSLRHVKDQSPWPADAGIPHS
jgi:hypothetical protein